METRCAVVVLIWWNSAKPRPRCVWSLWNWRLADVQEAVCKSSLLASATGTVIKPLFYSKDMLT